MQPTQTSAALAAQALVAVTGIFPSRPPSVGDMRAAVGMPARWRGRISRWLGSDKPEKWEYDPPPDMERLLKKLSEPIDNDDIEAWMMAIGEAEIGSEYVATIKRAKELLISLWPRMEDTGLKAQNYPLSKDEAERIWSIVLVIDDADALFDDFASNALTAEQVAAWRQIFTGLALEVDDILADAVIAQVVRKKELSWRHEDGVRLLRGLPMTASVRVEAPAPGEAPKPEAAKPIRFRAAQTETERVENRAVK